MHHPAILRQLSLTSLLVCLSLPLAAQESTDQPRRVDRDQNGKLAKDGPGSPERGQAARKGPLGSWAPLPTRTVKYKKTPQAELDLELYLPADWKETDKRPAIVFFFGGGWSSGTTTQFHPQASYLAKRGLVAACADYRVKSRHSVTPKECVEDAKSAIRYVRQHAATLGIDPQRIVASGGSAGAHIAACTALTPGLDAGDEDLGVSSRPNALVLFNPVLDLGSASLLQRVGGDEQLARLLSPTAQLSQDSPPTLLLFGTADSLYRQGQEFVERAAKVGSRAEMFTADGEKHGFFNASPWLERTLYRTDEFLGSLGYVEGKPTIDQK